MTSAILTPLFSESTIEKAELSENGYRWGTAEKYYFRVLKIPTFNAVFYKRYGSFLSKRARCQEEQLAGLEQALRMHKRALALSPNNADYW
ncbi:hypothetical protein EOM82_09615, partial [bacterium]|nr:hypothetical protein [bacterium]